MARRLIDIETARRTVVERVKPLSDESVPLRLALGRVLAEEVTSRDAIPPFDNSSMDGYAVRSTDTRVAASGARVPLRVVDESRAGSPAGLPVGQGEAIAISTGAMIPHGSDAVIRLEEVRQAGDLIEIQEAVWPGRDIRRAGEDVAAGEAVLARGTRIGPAELGVLASLGRAEISCGRRPRVAVLTTGDELVGPDEDLRPGAIRDANAYSVPALATAAGAELSAVRSAGDDATSTLEAIRGLLEADATVICGGVSVGEHDHVRWALAELDVTELFWGVALRPGRPTWFGVTRSGGLAFGLPGNPVSAMVTFLLFVRPALWALAGADPPRSRVTALLDEPYEKSPGRAHAVRVRLQARDDGWHARPTKEQGSHILTSMLGADGLAIVPAERGTVDAGERVDVELLPSSAS